MAVTLNITSGRKGGNPGGMCQVSNGMAPFDAYFKYVYGSKNGPNTTFNAAHQPAYEGITFQLARELGLKTPQTYVLNNKRRDIRFVNWNGLLDKDPSGRDFYFVSRLVPHRRKEVIDPAEAKELERERPYLEALLISDVIGKGQNYSFLPINGSGQVTYLDLGCSFVHAVGGFLTIPHKLSLVGHKQHRHDMRKIHNKRIVTSDNREVKLESLVDNLGDLQIPVLNPYGRLPVKVLISAPEIEEIQGHLTQRLIAALPDFRERGLLY